MRIIAFINDAGTVKKTLDHVGESTRPPRIAPARGPPLWEAAAAAEQAENDPQWDASAQSGDRVRSAHRLVDAGRCKIKTSRRSSWGDSCLRSGAWPPVATRRTSGSAWGAIRETFLRIVTHADPKSAIDRRLTAAPGGSHTPPKARWISYPS